MRAALDRLLVPDALEVAARQLRAAQTALLGYEEERERADAAVVATEQKIERLRKRIKDLSEEGREG